MKVINATVGPTSFVPQHLLFYLDAANSKCFVPGSMTATDLIGNKNITFRTAVQYHDDGIPHFDLTSTGMFGTCTGHPAFARVENVKSVAIWLYATKNQNYHVLDYVGENFYVNGDPFTVSTPELITYRNFDSGLDGWSSVLNTVTPPTSSFTWINDVSPDGSVGYAKFSPGIGTSTVEKVYTSITGLANVTHLVSFWKNSNTYRSTSTNTSVYTSTPGANMTNYIAMYDSGNKKESVLYTSFFAMDQLQFTRRGSTYNSADAFLFDNVSMKLFDIGKMNQWVHLVTTSDYLIQYITEIGASTFNNTRDSFVGSIAKVAMWDKKLSTEEVKKIYNIEKTRFGL